MQLSDRLYMNVSLVPKRAKVADIGCDHGYAVIWLVENGIAEKAIAMDVNEGPIRRAAEHVRRACMEDRIECRRSDGMEMLCSGEVDTLMIAGMGGPLMIRILREGKEVLERVETLVLQPQSEIGGVRRYVRENGFELAEEKICEEDGKYYFAMKAERSGSYAQDAWSEEWQYSYGTYLAEKKDPVLRRYLQRERRKYAGIIAQLHSETKQNERKCQLQHKINEIDKCLARMQEA